MPDSSVSEQVKLRCHRCSHFLGEVPGPVELVGVMRVADLMSSMTVPRYVYRCKCGWMNVFHPLTKSAA